VSFSFFIAASLWLRAISLLRLAVSDVVATRTSLQEKAPMLSRRTPAAQRGFSGRRRPRVVS